MHPSAEPLRDPRPTEAAEHSLADVPADWHDLWAQMLAVRAGQLPQPRGRHAALGRRPAAGWCVQGPVSARSAALFDLYKPLLDARAAGEARPWVVAQMGQSLDGFVATATGDSYYVNGAHSLVHLHRLRALCDAVLVGAGTVAIDNPQLTTRRVSGPHPVRVLLDPAARLDGRARALHDGQAPTLWVCDARHAARAHARLGPCAAEVLAVEGLLDESGPDPFNDTRQGGLDADGHSRPAWQVPRVLQALAARGLRVLFVEGGGVTVSHFFAAGALQRLHLSVAPVLVGNGRRGLRVPAHDVMADCPRPPARMVVLGDDMLWDLDLAATNHRA
jgi:diaminohydroxyphosphoribosylaminopyrimidine deaminase / 5-amino-6-(5-phosphoribosylamino)uracil reductase